MELVVIIIIIAIALFMLLIGSVLGESRSDNSTSSSKPRAIVKVYRGNQKQATAEFQTDSAKMASKNYYPTSQTWSPGSYGVGSFLVAAILCFALIGIIIFIYMFIVKPEGTLTVTYTLQEVATKPALASVVKEKTCPKCAEQVKEAAVVCRYCGHQFA